MKRWLTGVAWVLMAVAPAEAQRKSEGRALPSYLADRVIAVFEAPGTRMYEGGGRIGNREVVRGDVAVLEGRLELAGEVVGDVVVVNGDLILDSFARVTGDVIVLGGAVTGADGNVEGQVTAHDERIRYTRSDGRVRFEQARRGRYRGTGPAPRSRISVRVEGSYNRVEGLPVMVGPVLESGGWNHIRVDALAIWRSAEGFRVNRDEVGYLLRGEQHLGEDVQLVFGGSAYSMVSPIERWGVSGVESSLATALFHRDFRDFYEREGFGGFVRLAVPDEGVELTAEYRDEEHRFVPIADPWTWRNDDRAWRPQPLVAEGRPRTVSGALEVDRRNNRRDPTDGWFVEGRVTRGVGGSLAVPEYRAGAPAPANVVQAARPLANDFVDGFLDLRRYYRVGPGSDLRLRGLLAGSLDGNPLPAQFQHALGGVGSLPGHGLFSGDCGARSVEYSVLVSDGTTTLREPVFAGYGCDRIALFQAEYRGGLAFDFGWGDDADDEWDWSPDFDLDPHWSVFFNAGRGWTLADPATPAYLGPDTAELMDAGIGFFLGDLGLYWAWPLKGGGSGAHFFVRLDHRF